MACRPAGQKVLFSWQTNRHKIKLCVHLANNLVRLDFTTHIVPRRGQGDETHVKEETHVFLSIRPHSHGRGGLLGDCVKWRILWNVMEIVWELCRPFLIHSRKKTIAFCAIKSNMAHRVTRFCIILETILIMESNASPFQGLLKSNGS